MKIVDCNFAVHGERMLEIVNDAIANTTWVYDYTPRTTAQLSEYFSKRREQGYPVIVAQDSSGHLAGFGTFGEFRRLPGYKYTAEHSVFVAAEARGQGIGRQLLERLIELARSMDLHTLVGAIDSGNRPSIALHESLGFEHCGTLQQVGYKHDRWLDVLLYQILLPTPRSPAQD